MNEWPADWFRNDERAPSAGAAGSPGAGPAGDGAAGPAGAGDRTVQVSRPGAAGGRGTASGLPGAGAWPEQPPISSAAGAGRRAAGTASAGSQGTGTPVGTGGGGRGTVLPGSARKRRRPRARMILAIVAGLVAVLLAATGGLYFYLNSQLTRVSVLTAYPGRPAASAGQNWLITGSAGNLTRKQARKLHTGYGIDPTSDTIILLHIPAGGGRPILVSLPRDSYVPIPGHGESKINAAYSYGGAALMVRTVEEVTGLRINHYLGIGYAGLVSAVNAIGGVRMCVPHALRDSASGLRLHKGCQTLDGKRALAFVRARHPFATQDLQREQNQRVFIKAMLSKMTSPGTLLNPFAIIPAADGSASALTVNQGTQLYQLVSVAFALRDPITTTVPIANANYLTPAGDAVLWNRAGALRLFNDIRTDRPVPKSLLTGSHLEG